MRLGWVVAALCACVLFALSAHGALAQSTAVRPPFRLDQLVDQPTHAFPCNPSGVTGSLQSCTLASYFSFSGPAVSIDPAAFGALRAITTTSCLTGGGNLSVDRTFSIQGHCIDPTLLAFAPPHTFLGNNSSLSGEYLNLSASQSTAELNSFVGDSGGGGTKGLVPAPAAGDAGAGKCLGAGGGWVGCGSGGGSFVNPTITNPTITNGMSTGMAVKGLPVPTSGTDAATKDYVDGVAVDAIRHAQVDVASTAVLPNSPTYSNGPGTITSGTNTALVVDGVTVSAVGTRVLIKDQAAPAQNGIYTLTQAGTGSVPWRLTRATDFDTATAGEIAKGAYVFVGGGTLQATNWTMITLGAITVGTTSITWTTSGANAIYTASQGVQLVGNDFRLVTPISGAFGGDGVANTGTTFTRGGNLTTVGAFSTSFTMTAATSVTFPTGGTLLSSSGIPNCLSTEWLRGAAGAFLCDVVPTQHTIALGSEFSTRRGIKTDTFNPSTDTLYSINTSVDISTGRSVILTDIGKTLNMIAGTVQTITLPAATASPDLVSSPWNGFCIRDVAGLGFTVSASSALTGMPGLPGGNSFTFSPFSVVCPSVLSDGSGWVLWGQHGRFPFSQLPIISNGHVLGNASGSSAAAGDVTLVAGSGMSISSSGGNITFTSTAGGGDTVAIGLTAVGTGQSNCLQLTAKQSRITTSSASTAPYNAVCLPALLPGDPGTKVINRSANKIQVCPITGARINSLPVTTGCYDLDADRAALFVSQTSAVVDSIP